LAAGLPPALLIVVGLAVLLAGGEVLVRGASGLAKAVRISPLIVGLTVVAFGTSAPELAVVLQSGFAARGDPAVANVAIGNVVGSCIFNVLFVLGLTAIVRPVVVSAQLVRLEVPLMIAASLGLLVLGWDGHLGLVDGLLLFGALVGYIVWTVIQSRRESRHFQERFEQVIETRAGRLFGARARHAAVQLVLVVVGLVFLTIGSRALVDGSVKIARSLGVSELLIGLTIVAVGTSLPEIVTSVLASLRGHGDIAVGNVVGSNIFNILCVLGVAGIVVPQGIEISHEALWHRPLGRLPVFRLLRRLHRASDPGRHPARLEPNLHEDHALVRRPLDGCHPRHRRDPDAPIAQRRIRGLALRRRVGRKRGPGSVREDRMAFGLTLAERGVRPPFPRRRR
jgi:cation:H+ antiporter